MQDLSVGGLALLIILKIPLESITSFGEIHKIINDTTHVLPLSPFCTDLIFNTHDKKQWRKSFTLSKLPP